MPSHLLLLQQLASIGRMPLHGCNSRGAHENITRTRANIHTHIVPPACLQVAFPCLSPPSPWPNPCLGCQQSSPRYWQACPALNLPRQCMGGVWEVWSAKQPVSNMQQASMHACIREALGFNMLFFDVLSQHGGAALVVR
eukprot:1160652-Pelagomonas_calceolata.AAC.5